MTKKKDKILPIKVWLDEESCWNNQPQYSKGYVEYVREDHHAQAMLHVLQKGVKQGKKQALEEFEKNRLEHCDNITKEQYDLESDFVTSHIEKHHRTPTFIDAIEYGLEQGKKEMLEKVIEWLDNSLCCYIGAQNFTIEHDRLNKDLRKDMGL